MKRILFLLCLLPGASFAAAPPPAPACAIPPADYVAGVDAYGRKVAPADVPGPDIDVSTQIYAKVKTHDRHVKDVEVAVNLNGIGQVPPCAAPSAPPRR